MRWNSDQDITPTFPWNLEKYFVFLNDILISRVFFSIFYTGSNEHTSKSCESKLKGADAYRFAECFVCKQTGHLAKACPDNPKGLYPKGKQTHGETKIMSQKEIDLLRFHRIFFSVQIQSHINRKATNILVHSGISF